MTSGIGWGAMADPSPLPLMSAEERTRRIVDAPEMGELPLSDTRIMQSVIVTEIRAAEEAMRARTIEECAVWVGPNKFTPPSQWEIARHYAKRIRSLLTTKGDPR